LARTSSSLFVRQTITDRVGFGLSTSTEPRAAFSCSSRSAGWPTGSIGTPARPTDDRRVHAGGARRLPRDNDWLLTLQCVLEGALAVEDATIVSDVVDLLGPYSGRAVINAGAVMFHGVTDDTLGRAANLLGDRSEADRLSTAALATYDRIGAVW